MAFVTVEKGDPLDVGKKFPLSEKTLLIGRSNSDQKPDIALRDEHISRRHAEISFQNRYFLLRDLRSLNGTTLDGKRVEPEKLYRLQQDSVMGFAVISQSEARVMLRFKESPTAETTRMVLPDDSVHSDWIRIDKAKDEIYVDGNLIFVSKKEYDLLIYLHSKAGQVCTKDEIISEVYPEAVNTSGVFDAAIDQLVHRLRGKIESHSTKHERLITRRGFGYLLIP